MSEKTFAPHPEPTPDTTSGVGRRSLLAAGALAAAGSIAPAPAPAHARPAHAGGPRRGHSASAAMPLAFGPSRRMRIVQFNDTQGGADVDRRTVEFMGKVLDRERPDFALINGDVIDGSPRTDLEVKQAVNNVVSPMESRGIKWAIIFGNHDEDSVEEHGTVMTDSRILDFVASTGTTSTPRPCPASPVTPTRRSWCADPAASPRPSRSGCSTPAATPPRRTPAVSPRTASRATTGSAPSRSAGTRRPPRPPRPVSASRPRA